MTTTTASFGVQEEIDALRQELQTTVFDDGSHWRILFLGRSINGTTDIVASLSRSLQNLGHHVVDIDIKRHRITDNPERATGGNGPIYVRIDRLSSLLERFRPQMIVCCAGGLTFTREDAEILKQQGIVLVGLTLSDPDVFPTVHGHADVFDVHTTNAELCLSMYREAGVGNTVYFPFGIDRGFVTQDVPTAPEYAADVICLGHANNRPDRNGTMSALAESFDVKTYGRGWELPNSETVAGDRALQALKMGRIHINFPLTRAGYVNIKCGVFESIGAGALIATSTFPELARFFDYGSEIVGYDDVDDLKDTIDRLLADPEEYDRIRLNGFRRLVSEHLYEHRWMELFSRLRDASAESMPWLGDVRAAQVREILASSQPRARRVILSGFYGAGNLGDELILHSISSSLRDADPAVQVVVASEIPQRVELEHGLSAFKRTDIHEAAHQLHSADAVVVGGGGLWHDLTFQRAGGLSSLVNSSTMSIAGFGNLPLMGRVLGIPYHVIGMGAGPLTDVDAQAMVRYLAHQTESILVRDPESEAVLHAAGVEPHRVRSAPDVVYAVPLPPRSNHGGVLEILRDLRCGGRRLLGLNLRRWARGDMDQVVANVVAAITEVAQESPVAVVGVPMQAGPTHDAHILNQLAEQLPEHVPYFALPDPPDFTVFATALSELDGLAAMRLHAALIAHRYHVPTFGLAYDPKVRRHFEEVGRASWAAPLEADSATIARGIRGALRERRISDPAVLEGIAGLEAESSAALSAAARRVVGAPTKPVVHAIPTERPTVNVPQVATARLGATFTKAEFASEGLDLPERQLGVLFDAPKALHVSLPTTAPVAGQAIRAASTIRMTALDPAEVSFLLTSNYERPQNAGRVTIRLRIGEFEFEDDLSRSKEPVLLRLRTSGSIALPIELSLHVNNRCYPATSWPKFSRVGLRVTACHAIDDNGPMPSLFASAGRTTAIVP